MSSQPFRWRTVLEVGVISIVIYIVVGAPGLLVSLRGDSSIEKDVPVSEPKVESLVYPDKNLECDKHAFDIHMFSSSPLVIYIDGFLGQQEADHLVHISSDKWQISTVFNDGKESTDESVRKSDKALIDRDQTVQCIEQRALSVQGWPKETFIEPLWTQRYNVSGHYAHHYDWTFASKTSGRVSTFMVYLGAECKGGGTNFPELQMPKDRRWCQFVECDKDAGTEGVTFKPKKGSAVFWMNFDADGRGYKETIHAGMPVTSGTKIGLNIWSWYQAGHTAPEINDPKQL